jgi:hypothetical protein
MGGEIFSFFIIMTAAIGFDVRIPCLSPGCHVFASKHVGSCAIARVNSRIVVFLLAGATGSRPKQPI